LTEHENMANRPPKSAASKPHLVDPRYEVVFEETHVFANVVAELKSIGARSGSALGDAYALAAGAFLNGKERLEDLNAERRLRQRSRASKPSPAPVRADDLEPTRNASVEPS
jgi:hypothetical protein